MLKTNCKKCHEIKNNIRLLSKSNISEEVQGVYEPQNRSVHEVHEDSRTGATQKLPERCRFRKESIEELFGVFYKSSAFIFGLLAKFCFCKGLTFPILAFFMFYGLLTILRKLPEEKRIKTSFMTGLFFGIGYFGSTIYWIAESFKCVGMGNYGYLAVVFLILYCSVYSGFTCLLTQLFQKTRLSQILFFCVFWVCFEYLRGIVFTGFPWNFIGYAAIDIPYLCQISDIFGIYGLSFVFLLILTLFSCKRTLIYGAIIATITISYGYYKIEIDKNYQNSEYQGSLTIVQPSIPQEDKLNRNNFRAHLEKHIAMSGTGNIHQRRNLVIWPEGTINIPMTKQNGILEYIRSHIRYNDTFIITGTDRVDQDNNVYNSLSVIGDKSRLLQIYDKRHLLPFGEFIPEFLLNIGLKKVTQGAVNFSIGTQTRTIKIDGLESFEAVICYEIAFPGEILDDPNSKWILNITNDAWFKNTDGPSQHLRMACIRAIEEGRSVVRCASNGISCVIDCNGRILKKLDTDIEGVINHPIPQQYKNTFFSKYHNKSAAILIFAFFVFGVYRRRKIKKKTYIK